MKKRIFIYFGIISILLAFLPFFSFEAFVSLSGRLYIDKPGYILIKEKDDYIYYSNGNITEYLTEDEIPNYVFEYLIGLEDQNFYNHKGYDIKRIVKSLIDNTVSNKIVGGGSTITQQLVKNMMKEDEDEGLAGVRRKIREWSRAYQIEQMLSKNQILETYLNQVFMGGGTNIYGVEKASKYYFNKSASELTLAEAAFLAGINRAPNAYNPYEEGNEEAIKKVTKTVLVKMKELGMIETEEEYNEAIATVDKGLTFTKGEIVDSTDISYHTAAAIDQVAEDIAEQKEVNIKEARRILYSGGYKLYTTQVTSIQERMEKEYLRDKYIFDSKITKDENGKYKHTQSGMTIIEQTTGKVVGAMGGLGSDSSPTELRKHLDNVVLQ